MATIVNARDVLLQAVPANSRVAGVTMASNINVSQENVTGLGLVVEGTRQVALVASSQVFQIPKVGAVSPASITITPSVRNISGLPSVSVQSGTISPAPSIVGGVITIPYANLITDTATVRVSATQGSTTYYDEITLVKVREGIDSLNGFLTNEAHTLPSDSIGNVTNYGGASGNFKVFQGTSDVTSACAYTIVANPNSVTCSINATTGAYSVTGNIPTGVDGITVTFRATLGTVSIDKIFTITKSRNGGSGVRGSRTFYVTLSGGTNVFSDALATSTASVDGGPILNDVVTQSNSSVGFSQTRFWNGGAWVVVNAVVDGNLLVPGTVGAGAISVNTLTAIQASLGTAQIDSGGYLRTAGATAFGTGNGIWMGYDSSTYKFRVGNPTGNRMSWDGSNLKITGELLGGAFTGYSWPPAGQTGFYLGPSGLLIGNSNDGRYFQVTASGNIYSEAYDMVDGVMTLKQVNVVNTSNIVNDAVSTMNSVSGTAGSITTNFSVPAGETWKIVCLGYQDGYVVNGGTSPIGDTSTPLTLNTTTNNLLIVEIDTGADTPLYKQFVQGGSVSHIATVTGSSTFTATLSGTGGINKTLILLGYKK